MNATVKHSMEYRTKGYWQWSGASHTCVPQERGPEAKDYKSTEMLLTDRRKHVRTGHGPQHKFTEPVATSHEVGWLQSGLTYPDGDKLWLRPPIAPVRSSTMTKYKDNLE